MKTIVIFDAGYDGELVGVVPMRAREFKQACQSFKFVEVGDKFVNVDKIIFFMDKVEYDKMMALKRKSKNVSVANRKLRVTAEDIVNGFDLPIEQSIQRTVKEITERVFNDDKEQNASTRF